MPWPAEASSRGASSREILSSFWYPRYSALSWSAHNVRMAAEPPRLPRVAVVPCALAGRGSHQPSRYRGL